MTDFITQLLNNNQEVSYLISISINIIISLFAFIPSFFVTAANIYVFGLWEGIMLSLVGEVTGSIISLYLYRKGIKLLIKEKELRFPLVNRLTTSTGAGAFFVIFSLRLLPFVPSGLINIGASFSSVTLTTFGLATLLGKIPAVLIEGFAVSQYMNWEGQEKIYMTIAGLVLFGIYILIKRKQANHSKP
ncbi:TVP38/TMEM64 family protein [Bacillus sp. AK128]